MQDVPHPGVLASSAVGLLLAGFSCRKLRKEQGFGSRMSSFLQALKL